MLQGARCKEPGGEVPGSQEEAGDLHLLRSCEKVPGALLGQSSPAVRGGLRGRQAVLTSHT